MDYKLSYYTIIFLIKRYKILNNLSIICMLCAMIGIDERGRQKDIDRDSEGNRYIGRQRQRQ